MPLPIDTATGQTENPAQQLYGAPPVVPPTYPQNSDRYGHGVPEADAAACNRPGATSVDDTGKSKAQGTTFSSVAFALVTNNECKENIITEWPGTGNQSKQKIPTILYYDQQRKVIGWGSDVAKALAPTGYPKPSIQKVEWFKLQLALSGNTPLAFPPLPPGKSEIDVAADYLFHLQQAIRNQLQKTLGAAFDGEEHNIRYYFTVPASWNDAAFAALRAAALQAGFLRAENENRLTFIASSEAAAMFYFKTSLLNVKVRDAVLVVDCGGGIVDMIAYEVEEEQPFSLVECTVSSGDSCGSTVLNRNFSNLLRAKIRKMKIPVPSKAYARCIIDFEKRIKSNFKNDGQKWAVDVGMWAVDVGVEAKFSEAGIEEGCMIFTNDEILQCFDPVVNRIVELVQNQITAVQAQKRSLQKLLIVGGFGASEYLFQQIKLHIPPPLQPKVVQPIEPVTGIARGAVMAGFPDRIAIDRVAHRHYLIATPQPFKADHPEQYCVPSLDSKGKYKYAHQIIVQKGQRVKIGELVKASFFGQVALRETLMATCTLHACADDVCPDFTNDLRIEEVATWTADLSGKTLEKDFERINTPQGTFYRACFDIYLNFDGFGFNAELVCSGEAMGRRWVRFR